MDNPRYSYEFNYSLSVILLVVVRISANTYLVNILCSVRVIVWCYIMVQEYKVVFDTQINSKTLFLKMISI